MPFEIYLSPTTASPPVAQVQADVRSAIASDGGRFDPDGATVVTSDGLQFVLAGDGQHFLIDHLSPSFCRIVFNAARQSNSTVERGGSDLAPLQMEGSSGASRYVGLRSDSIADPIALCVRLGRDLQDWNRFISGAQSGGLIGPDEQPLEPPPSPGTETSVTADLTGVAAHCQVVQQSFASRGWKIARHVVSRNAQYGVVWRADMTAPGDSGVSTRLICWKIPGHAGYSIVARPLQMFDPSASVPPLAP